LARIKKDEDDGETDKSKSAEQIQSDAVIRSRQVVLPVLPRHVPKKIVKSYAEVTM
jgi:hypothetical protein